MDPSRAAVRPPPPRTWRARVLRVMGGVLMPVGVGVIALLVTVAIGSVRNGANRVPAAPTNLKTRAAGAPLQPVVTPMPTPLMAPAVPAPPHPAPVEAIENRPVTVMRPIRSGVVPVPPAADVQSVIAAPAPAPAADQEGAAPSRAGQRLQARTRPPRPIDVGDPYAP